MGTFSKLFVIFLFIDAVIAYGTKSWANFFILLGLYAIITIIWRILTR